MKNKERGACPHCDRRRYARPFTSVDRVKRICYAHSHIPGEAAPGHGSGPGAGEVCAEDRGGG